MNLLHHQKLKLMGTIFLSAGWKRLIVWLTLICPISARTKRINRSFRKPGTVKTGDLFGLNRNLEIPLNDFAIAEADPFRSPQRLVEVSIGNEAIPINEYHPRNHIANYHKWFERAVRKLPSS